MLYDVCNPAQASSIFLSNNGEDFLTAVVVVCDGDINNWRGVPELYKDTNYGSLYITNDLSYIMENEKKKKPEIQTNDDNYYKYQADFEGEDDEEISGED